MYKIESSENIKTEKINAIIDEHITNLNFHSNINNLIISNLSNRKTLNYSRNKIVDKIMESQYVKEKENEIMDELYKHYKIELSNKEKEALLVKQGRKNLRNNIKKRENPTSLRDSIISKVSNLALDNNNSNNNLDSEKLFNILLEEFLNCDDKIKIENYLGDITNFDDQLIMESQYLPDIIKKVGLFMEYITSSEYSNDIYLIPNLISFFTKFSKKCNENYLFEICIILLKYLNFTIEKFYKLNFDITKFYKISFNVECLINLILNLYNLKDQHLNIEEEKLNLFVDKFFSCVLINYENNIRTIPDDNLEFGISTNYILLLFFLFDPDFLALKIMFRFTSLRKYIVKKFSPTITQLAFKDSQSFINTCGKKYCFLWKHLSILEQIFPNKKISKRFLIFSWASIKIHFLGFVFRYKPLRKIDCYTHFRNLIDYLIETLYKTKTIGDETIEIEEEQVESLFYLIKEVLCDCIIYCEDHECLTSKFKHINELYMDQKYKSNKQFKYLLDDLVLALKNNFYSPVNDV